MILQREIASIAQEAGVSRTTIDKDWVLGHVIDAIYSITELRKALVFKGGTCLKKCYFPEYRFSEDLDFTSKDEIFVLTEQLLKKIIALVNKRSGISCHIVSLRDLRFENKKTGYEAIIKYWGADHQINSPVPPPERWLTSIKIEIILYEVLLFAPVKKKVIHPYSDKLSAHADKTPCYDISEVMSEKMRALMQRKYTAPRDYYDIWYLVKNYPGLDYNKITHAFHKKVRYKNLEFKNIKQLIDEDEDKKLRTSWTNSLAHQIKKEVLPEYDIVKNELKALFKKIFR
ncbi:MAG TPA: nucleotidyl transferase AbiEii/AbiGii toxin family protein [Bacteroidia bacterium]|nr:nucleotidyl transferase AbiEii/AbiGii toxin family protein [Bacteroidia bacterium]